MKIVPVILSGGSGTRLWPLSRSQYPKQLLPLSGDKSLIQQTALRINGIEGVGEPVIVANEAHRFVIRDQLEDAGISPGRIILETQGRNTAPALTLAAMYIQEKYGDAIMFVMPADHVILDQAALLAAVQKGTELVLKNKLVTFGIQPTRAETGFGYIKAGSNNDVDSFVEKPDQVTAQKYVESGEYYWNSGMFMISSAQWLQEQKKFNKKIIDACAASYSEGIEDDVFFRPSAEAFARSPEASIDKSVMEHTENAAVVPLDAGWSDIGSWTALRELGQQDTDGNVSVGDTYMLDTRNSYINAQHRLVATLGVRDLVVVETADAVLITDTERSQDVKAITQILKEEGRTESDYHRRVYRPWGFFDSVDQGEGFQVKRITVKPGAALSLQSHKYRAEHWVVVSGEATVTRGEEQLVLHANQSTYIPLGTRHRLENRSSELLEIIEVQTGSYLGEDDIERFEDEYHRE